MLRSSIPILLIVSLILFSALTSVPPPGPDYRKEINEWYLKKLEVLEKSIRKLDSLNKANASADSLRNQFLEMRRNFKRIAVITDYFNLNETRLWNSPAIPRIEDDSPHRIIAPQGFQKLEELLWTDEGLQTNDIDAELQYLLEVVASLFREPDRINKFRNPEVWEAFFQSVIRVTSLGISGFDSPVAFLSIEEAKASLEGLEELINIYAPAFCCDRAAVFRELNQRLVSAQRFLASPEDFNSFDRLEFIRNELNPLSEQIRLVINAGEFQLSPGRRSVNTQAKNIFEADALDIRFFSPNQRYQITPERVSLGRKLFNDTRLSGTGTRSCASCHQPAKAFTDGRVKAIALDEKSALSRNTPTLWNVAFQTKQFYDSRETMLEFQISDVVHNVREMKGRLDQVSDNMTGDSSYVVAFKKAYPADAVPVSPYTISNAVASYLRSLRSFNSRFDRYIRKESDAFSAKEKNGFNIFMGKAKCGTCHFLPLFNGLTPPGFSDSESEVLGVPLNKNKPATLDPDSGKYNFTRSPVHLFSFKTPTVRNIALTAPYMHNGVFNTLQEVVDFYNEGGGAGLGIAPENQTLPPDKLNLTKKEKRI